MVITCSAEWIQKMRIHVWGTALLLIMVGGIIAWRVLGIASSRPLVPSYDTSQFIELGEFRTDRLPIYADHKYMFLNTSREALSIVEVKASCSCKTFGFDEDEIIEPGGVTSLKAGLALNQSGGRSATILITWSDGKQTHLQMRAVAIITQQYLVAPRSWRLRSGETGEFSITFVTTDMAMPPRIEYEAPDHLSITLNSWVQLIKSDDSLHNAARYMLTGRVMANRALERPTSFTLRVGELGDEQLFVEPAHKASKPHHDAPSTQSDG